MKVKGTEVIVIERAFFEHLLNCLSNQKFISELLPEEQHVNQLIIDRAWNQGMYILSKNKYPMKALPFTINDSGKSFWSEEIE